MGVLFTTGLKYAYDRAYKVDIIDKDAATDNNALFQLRSDSFDVNDEDYNLVSHIAPVSYVIEAFQTPALISFINDFIENGEGRYFLKLSDSIGKVFFFGRLIIDSIEIGTEKLDTIRFTAIDGLTLLKNIDFEIVDGSIKTIFGIIHQCLKKLDKWALHGATDAWLITSTKFYLNDPTFTPNVSEPLNAIGHYGYWQKGENKKSCWDVLSEILKRYGLRLDSVDNRYYVRFTKLIYTNVTNYKPYDKNGNLLTGVLHFGQNFNAINTFGRNGKYHLSGGVKAVTFKRQKEFIDARNIVRKIAPYGVQEWIGYYESVGAELIIKFRQNSGLPFTHREARLTILIELQGETETKYIQLKNPITYMQSEALGIITYEHQEPTTTVNNDVRIKLDSDTSAARVFSVKPKLTGKVRVRCYAVFVGFYDAINNQLSTNGSTTNITCEILDQAKDTTEFELVTERNTTNNYTDSIIELMATDTNCNKLSIGYLTSSAIQANNYTTDVIISSLKNKFATEDIYTYDYVDRAILNDFLRFLTPVKKMYFGTINLKDRRPITVLDTFTYGGEIFMVKSVKQSIFDYHANVVGVKIGVKPIVPIEVPPTKEPPNHLPDLGGLWGSKSGINGTTEEPYFEEFLNVTGNEVTFTNYSLPITLVPGEARTYPSMKKSIEIHVDDSLFYMVNLESELKARDSSYITLGNNKIKFSRPLDGSRVTIKIHNYIKFGTVI
jgi:hypothetical protein